MADVCNCNFHMFNLLVAAYVSALAALSLQDLTSPIADSHLASVFRTFGTMSKRAQHPARKNLRAESSTNLSSSVAMSGVSSSIHEHTVHLEFSSAHVGAYYLMRALSFSAEVSAKFVFWMAEHEVLEQRWGSAASMQPKTKSALMWFWSRGRRHQTVLIASQDCRGWPPSWLVLET